MGEPRRERRLRAGQRGAALLPLAVLAVHQLRYLLAYGSQYGRELSGRGDAYVGRLTPVCVALLALLLGAALGRAGEAWRTGESGGRSSPGGWRLWAAVTLTLVACFCLQEWLEIVLEPGHAGSIAGVFGSGGWTAVPAAAALAGVLVALMRGADIALAALARRSRARARRDRRRAAGARGGGSGAGRPARPAPLAGCAAGRAPPRPAAA